MSFSPFRLKPTIWVVKAPSPRSSAVITRNALASADLGAGSHRWEPSFIGLTRINLRKPVRPFDEFLSALKFPNEEPRRPSRTPEPPAAGTAALREEATTSPSTTLLVVVLAAFRVYGTLICQ
jgi:hypothetical protein